MRLGRATNASRHDDAYGVPLRGASPEGALAARGEGWSAPPHPRCEAFTFCENARRRDDGTMLTWTGQQRGCGGVCGPEAISLQCGVKEEDTTCGGEGVMNK